MLDMENTKNTKCTQCLWCTKEKLEGKSLCEQCYEKRKTRGKKKSSVNKETESQSIYFSQMKTFNEFKDRNWIKFHNYIKIKNEPSFVRVPVALEVLNCDFYLPTLDAVKLPFSKETKHLFYKSIHQEISLQKIPSVLWNEAGKDPFNIPNLKLYFDEPLTDKIYTVKVHYEDHFITTLTYINEKYAYVSSIDSNNKTILTLYNGVYFYNNDEIHLEENSPLKLKPKNRYSRNTSPCSIYFIPSTPLNTDENRLDSFSCACLCQQS